MTPFVEEGIRSGRRLTYFRIASHEPVVSPQPGIDVHELRPEDGFETFIARIHKVIEEAGRGALSRFSTVTPRR